LTLGEKIKELRKKRSMTQSEIAGDMITRNMLSQIERGAACPSLQTIIYIAKKLDMDPGYFLCEEDNLSAYELSATLPRIRAAFRSGNHVHAIKLASPFEDDGCDEISLILCECSFNNAKAAFVRGSLSSAADLFQKTIEYGKKTVYPTSSPDISRFYLDIIKKTQGLITRTPSPLEQIDVQRDFIDLTLYVYLINLIDDGMPDKAAAIYDTVKLKSELFRLHINARLAAARFNYERSKELLLEIVNSAESEKFSAPFMYSVCQDLEAACKALSDFEGAYRCANMKLKYITNMSK